VRYRLATLAAILVVALLIPGQVIAQTDVHTQGLGLTTAELTARYGAPLEDIMGDAYDGDAYEVGNGKLVAYSLLGDPAPIIERIFILPVSYSDAVMASRTLMPDDAVTVGQYVNDADIVVDVYTSEWLSTKYSDPEDWEGAAPGTFTVSYGAYNPMLGTDQVTVMMLVLGDAP